MIVPQGRPFFMRTAGLSVCALLIFGGGGPLRPLLGPLPVSAQEAASAVQDVTLQNVTMTFGGTVLTAPQVIVSGTRLTKDDLLGLLRSGPEPLAARLAKFDAASIVIPELRSETRIGTKTQNATYRDVTAKDVRGGRIAQASAAGLTAVEAGGEAKHSASYGRIEMKDVDLAAMARLYGEAGDAKSPMLRIYGAFSAADISMEAEGTVVKIARLEGSDVSGRQIPATWTGALDAMSRVDPIQPASADKARILGTVADLIDGFSVGSFQASGLTINQTHDGEPVAMTMGRMAFASGNLTFEDLGFTVGEAGGKLSRLSFAGFSFAPTVAAMRKLSTQAGEPTEADLRQMTPVLGTLAFKDLSLDLPPDEVSAPPKPSAKPPGAPSPAAATAPKHIGLRDGAFAFGPLRDGLPTTGRANLSGLTLPASAVAGIPGLGSLGAYGYRDLDLDVVADTAWNEAAKELTFSEVSVSGKDMGSVKINGTLGGIGPAVFDPDPSVSTFAMLGATAKTLDLRIENTGLFERFIATQSKSLSLKPEELTQEYVTATTFGVPAILGNSAGAKAIGAALGQFVMKPGTLLLSAKAKNAGGIGMLEFSAAPTPGAVLDRLDVSAKAN
ncbi:hypothetical protein [Methylobacterium sp. E-045]|uniref:hypothetical protein n=1 Tax=Methylobacterium sp. E-045 TaxID=2836575 RepID=UPI001FB87EFF|nr:hypothetical protein [Methylobacterium sp. E-045]MCJ2128854.1 hypothetical protein [Methylobacterium sp. E-045]